MISAKNINEHTPMEGLTPGGEIYEPGTARDFDTGTWRTDTPVFIAEAWGHCRCSAPRGTYFVSYRPFQFCDEKYG